MITRREWVRAVGAGMTGLALGCGDNLSAPDDDATAAVFEPTPTSLLVSVWCPTPGRATVELERDGDVVALEELHVGDSGTGVIDLDRLAADTAYTVTVTTPAGVRSGPYRVRTAPADTDARPVRIAVSADFDPVPLFDSTLIEQVVATEPELFVAIGDFPYTDDGPPAMTLAEYRARHAALRTAPAMRRLFEVMPVRAIYDDHEFRNDWDTRRALDEPERFAAAMQAWDEFFPLRAPSGSVRYRSWRWGAHVEGFLLDCRRFRSANDAVDDATKTMLGDTQRAWITDALARSTATFKLVFTSVPLDFGIGVDHWAGFTTEREQLLAALVGIPGILFISADQHYFASYEHAHGVREIQVGPIARGIGEPGPVAPGVRFRSHQYNAGIFEAGPDGLRVIGLGATGERFFDETLTANVLTPR